MKRISKVFSDEFPKDAPASTIKLLGTPHWYKLYSARSSYGMAGQRPNDWKEFVNKMETSQEAFDLYHKYVTYFKQEKNP